MNRSRLPNAPMSRLQRHVFVCVNERDDQSRPSCGGQEALEIHRVLKQKVKEAGLQGAIRVNKAGCLDVCAQGVVMVTYPEQIWYGNVTREDCDEIYEKTIRHGEPISRLEILKKDN